MDNNTVYSLYENGVTFPGIDFPDEIDFIDFWNGVNFDNCSVEQLNSCVMAYSKDRGFVSDFYSIFENMIIRLLLDRLLKEGTSDKEKTMIGDILSMFDNHSHSRY